MKYAQPALFSGALLFASLLFATPAKALQMDVEAEVWISQSNEPTGLFIAELWAQNGQLRSKAEVVSEVKQRYQARVLKIKLNSSRTAYKVRILLPNGKVKEVRVRATR